MTYPVFNYFVMILINVNLFYAKMYMLFAMEKKKKKKRNLKFKMSVYNVFKGKDKCLERKIHQN